MLEEWTIRQVTSALRSSVAFTVKWTLLTLPLGVISGSACALFLASLEAVTDLRFEYPWLMFGLPLAGLVMAAGYAWLGRSVEAGNNLILARIHEYEPGQETIPDADHSDEGVPFRMAPLVLAGTLLTHLCGGSAGREGTAVQMSGGIAGAMIRLLPGLSRPDARLLLIAAIAAGFGGVFGTPVAGAVFAMEVVRHRKLNHTVVVPCLMASVISHFACAGWGVGHTAYEITTALPVAAVPHGVLPHLTLLGAAVASGIVFGLISLLFCEMVHGIARVGVRMIPSGIVRAAIGGALVIAVAFLGGAVEYLGLGVTSPHPDDVTIVSSFRAGGADLFSWLWKSVLTAMTVGTGFKGGEVTPLFFIGATAGNAVATVVGLPIDLWAALGFIAVFAGATNTPIACTFMSAELFGGEFILYFAVSCAMASLFSGKTGIYAVPEMNSAH